MSDDEPPRVYFYVSRAAYDSGRRTAVPVVLLNGDSYMQYVRALAGRWKGRAFSITKPELYSYVPSDAKLVPGGRAFLPVQCPEERSARALEKRMRALNVDNDWTVSRADRAFRAIEGIAESLHTKNPSDISWRYYGEHRERWLRDRERLHGLGGWIASPNSSLALLFAMLQDVLGAAERARPCTGHSDCREHPELGAACTAAGTARRLR